MDAVLKCAVCGVVLTTADAEFLVTTDAGLVHRECFEGPTPPGSEVDLDDLELAAENERRRDHGEPELTITEWKSAEDLPDDGDGQLEAYAQMLGLTKVGPGHYAVDERSARASATMAREDLDTPLDPDRRI